MRFLSLFAAVSVVAAAAPGMRRVSGMRADGADVFLPPSDALRAELAVPKLGDYPFVPFSQSYVKAALAQSVDWRAKGLVTPAKDQGATGTCGTFGRLAAAEGQFARHAGPLTNFSEEEMYDCIGWDMDQFSYFSPKGFMTSEDYPFNGSAVPGGDRDPPVPGRPCRYAAHPRRSSRGSRRRRDGDLAGCRTARAQARKQAGGERREATSLRKIRD